MEVPKAVEWLDGRLRLLDQTRLPQVESYIDCNDIKEVRDAIARLSVRGAPAIGITAAYGLIVGVQPGSDLYERLSERAEYLIGARPTAVNLAWAVRRMMSVADAAKDCTPEQILVRLEQEAIRIQEEDAAACRAIGEAGLPLVKKHPRLLTHCNAGALAVSELGTALAPIYLAHRAGIDLHVYVDETRPLLQGARLTTFELQRAGIPHTLISDSAAAHIIASREVDAVIVGADRVVANGDVANKIGTLGLAIVCHHFGVPFYVACPRSTIDPDTPSGDQIVIEERPAEEVTAFSGARYTAEGTQARNPAFDVTPAALVTAIITDRGVVEPPYDNHLLELPA